MIEESSFAGHVTMAFRRSEGEKTSTCMDFRELNKLLIPESQPFHSHRGHHYTYSWMQMVFSCTH